MTPKRSNLDEVSFIRPILIVLLVLYHSFAIYSGAWHAPEGMVYYSPYKWIAKGSYSFLLESFVFISGYLFAFQNESSNKVKSFWPIIKKKFLRLIVPSLVFSSLYVLLFIREGSAIKALYTICEGAGHLWFLPMLFWCFVMGVPIVKNGIKRPVPLLLLLAFLSFFSFVKLPLRFSTTFNYLFFFIFGYICWINRDSLYCKLKDRILLVFLLFVILFCLSSFSLDIIKAKIELLNLPLVQYLVSGYAHAFRFLYASAGVLAFWLFSIWITSTKTLPQWYIGLGSYCMGTYIFQQFILVYIVYYSSLPSSLGFIWLPWVAFFITLLSSLLLSYTVKNI